MVDAIKIRDHNIGEKQYRLLSLQNRNEQPNEIYFPFSVGWSRPCLIPCPTSTVIALNPNTFIRGPTYFPSSLGLVLHGCALERIKMALPWQRSIVPYQSVTYEVVWKISRKPPFWKFSCNCICLSVFTIQRSISVVSPERLHIKYGGHIMYHIKHTKWK